MIDDDFSIVLRQTLQELDRLVEATKNGYGIRGVYALHDDLKLKQEQVDRANYNLKNEHTFVQSVSEKLQECQARAEKDAKSIDSLKEQILGKVTGEPEEKEENKENQEW